MTAHGRRIVGQKTVKTMVGGGEGTVGMLEWQNGNFTKLSCPLAYATRDTSKCVQNSVYILYNIKIEDETNQSRNCNEVIGTLYSPKFTINNK